MSQGCFHARDKPEFWSNSQSKSGITLEEIIQGSITLTL